MSQYHFQIKNMKKKSKLSDFKMKETIL